MDHNYYQNKNQCGDRSLNSYDRVVKRQFQVSDKFEEGFPRLVSHLWKRSPEEFERSISQELADLERRRRAVQRLYADVERQVHERFSKTLCSHYGITPFDPTLNAEEEKRAFSILKNDVVHFQFSAPIPSVIPEEDVISFRNEEGTRKLWVHTEEPKIVQKNSNKEDTPRTRVFGNYRMPNAMGNPAETEIENLKENPGNAEEFQMGKEIKKTIQ
uniref:Uncharacterized protein n=1 Tax=Lepeophtheirus salmonis TaxID=72036 RepID=A0A0K2UJB2_LEPSM